VEIIQTLRANNSADAAEQLFKTLTETSIEVNKATEDVEDKSTMDIDAQLKLLLEKLNKNANLSAKAPEKL
jgi:hypothetical protein